MLSNMESEPVWRLALVADQDREVEFHHLWFLPFMYIYGLGGLFHCIQSTHFS
jgi:hypothetical protein